MTSEIPAQDAAPVPPTPALPRCETAPEVTISDRVFKRFLRFPVTREFEGALAENATWARDWFETHGRPWLVALEVTTPLRAHLPDTLSSEPRLGLIIASAGPEAEAAAQVCWRNDEPDRYYFLECYAAAVVEELLNRTRNALGARKHLSPGYPEWSISANPPLLDVLKDTVSLPGPLRALESGMLEPKKSQIAVFILPETA